MTKKTDKDEEKVLVCTRVADLEKPYVPSVNTACDNCTELCWVDKRIAKIMGQFNRVVCTHCLSKELENAKSNKA